MASVQNAMRHCLQHHAAELADSLLHLDSGAAQAVAAGIGLDFLRELGVAASCDLAAASPADLLTAGLLSGGAAPIRRVVFAVTTLLAQAEAAVLAAASLHQPAAQFTVLCAVSQAAHHEEEPALYGAACYPAVASAWQQQLNAARAAAGHGPCSVAVLYCPLLLCPLGSAAFVLPPSAAAVTLPQVGQLAAGFSPHAPAAAGGDSNDETGAVLPHQQAPRTGGGPGGTAAPAASLQLLAHALVGALAALGHRPEAFALGPTSRAIVRHMAFVPTPAEDAPAAALVLVDRWLDPVSPAQHADLLLERAFDCLQQQHHGGEARRGATQASGGAPGGGAGGAGIPPASAAAFAPPFGTVPVPGLDGLEEAGGGQGHGQGGSEAGSVLPGSLPHPGDVQAEHWLDFLLTRQGRDGPLYLRKWLREAARKEGASQQQRFKPGTITAAEVRSLADGIRRRSPAAARRHRALLDLAAAAAAALDTAGSTHARRWEALQREEKALLFACSESAEAVAAHLVDLCRLAGTGGTADAAVDGPTPVQLADVLALVLAAYCLLPDFLPWYASGTDGGQDATASPFSSQQEQHLEEALVDALMASAAAAATGGTASSSVAAEHGVQGAVLLPAPALPPKAAHLPPALAAVFRRAQLAAGKQGAASTAGPHGGNEAAQQHGEQQCTTETHPSASGGSGSDGGGGGWHGEELSALRLEATDAVHAALAQLRQLAAARRQHLKHLKPLAASGSGGTPTLVPLLRQVAEAILQDRPLPDLHAGATSLKGLLRSGLGRFGLQAGPKPSDCATVVLFVVGGVSLAELHAVLQAVDQRAAATNGTGSGGNDKGNGASLKPAPRIIVGGTALLRPGEVCSHLLI